MQFHDRDLALSEERQRLADIANAGAATAGWVMSTPAITVQPATPRRSGLDVECP